MKGFKAEHIAIIGTGMIGTSFAVLTSSHGCRTTILARKVASMERSKSGLEQFYQDMVDQGVMSREQADICESYVDYVYDYADLADVDVVYEAIVEDLEAKHVVYGKIEANCPNVELIMSGSSAILPDRLAEGFEKYRDRVVVAHPFYPSHMVPYFEIVKSDLYSAPGIAELAEGFLEALDRKPVVLKKAVPGFIGNYLQFALWAAALKLVEDGVCEPEDIDACLNYSFCPRYTSIGMFQHFDNGGYKLNMATCNAVFPSLPRYDGAPDCIVEKATSEDAWGAKSPTKRGFYDWNGVDMAAYQGKVLAPYWKFIDWEFPTEPCER